MDGRFVTFEGGEGTGKSTQIKLVAERLKTAGVEVLQTREPGGTPESEALRNLLVNGDASRWSAAAEALLNYAARDSHLRKVIRPALISGKVVLCDRFMDSTRAYQGYAGQCDMHLIDSLERAIVGATRPGLTLIFDLDPEAGLARARARNDRMEDRYERKGLEFHRRLRDGFMQIAEQEAQRCRVIDAAGSIEEVASRVNAVLRDLLHG